MKRLINDGDLFDKYASLGEKDAHGDKLGRFNWTGHRHISGTYYGAAYSTQVANNYIASDLRSDSNPHGSLLMEAKNYTDSKVATAGKTLYSHFITLIKGNNTIFFTYISSQSKQYVVASLKNEFHNKGVVCSGY